MNKKYKTFEECKKMIKELIREEKQTKQRLENIQQTKMECIRILLDEEYAKFRSDEIENNEK